MLVLSRKPTESVHLTMTIGDTKKEVKVSVIDVSRKKVRLGFDTDPDVTILREELLKLDTVLPAPA